MKSYYLLVSLALFAMATAAAQQDGIRRLHALHRELAANLGNDTATVNHFVKIGSWHLKASQKKAFPKSRDSASHYAMQAYNLASKTPDGTAKGNSFMLYGKIAFENYEDPKAQKWARQALDAYERGNNKHGCAEANFLLAKSIQSDSHITAMETATKAMDVYRRLGDRFQQGNVMRYMGEISINKDDFGKGLSYYTEALDLLRTGKNGNEEIMEAMLGASAASYSLGNLKEAFNYSLEAVKMAERTDPASHIAARSYSSLGKLYHTMSDQKNAYHYLRKAFEVSEKYSEEDLSTLTNGNMVRLLFDMKRHREALTYLKRMEQKTNIGKAAKITVVLRSLQAYLSLKDLKNAKGYVEKATKLIREFKDNPSISRLYDPVANYYFETGQYQLSRQYLEQYKAWAETKSSDIALEQIHKRLYRLDSVEKRYESAIKNIKLADLYNRTILDQETKKSIGEMQVQYDLVKKDRDLKLQLANNELLVKQGELQTEKLARSILTRNVGLGGVGILILLMGLLYGRYKNNRRTNRILQDKQAEVSQSNEVLKHLVIEKELLLKEIHHRVKNNLHIVMSLLNSQSYFLEDRAALAAIRNSQHRIQSMSLIHQKLYMADTLTGIRMPDYVNELVAYLKESFSERDAVDFKVQVADVEMDVSQAVPLGLILNEAITNCFKYAFPGGIGTIVISLVCTHDEHFRLEILDDGVGIPPDYDATNAKSLGMKLIHGLAQDLDGQLKIDGGSGTRVSVVFRYKTFAPIETRQINLTSI